MVTKKGKKITGGRYIKSRKKRRSEISKLRRIVKLSEDKRKNIRIRGGSKKTILLGGQIINVLSKNKTKKTKIKNVLETPSNRFFARQNILTKGTIVETDLGKVKITNRPTQEGNINGILVE
jgi:small subunit ribosomal protein S8e